MNTMTIANTAIRRDAEGRFCLNDLHRASGGEKRHGPSYWMANAKTRALIDELTTTGNPVVTLEGVKGGTYVAKELVYAYAMWISPAFHLKVIRAYDAMLTTPAPQFEIPQTLPDALRLAADLADQKAVAEAEARRLSHQVAEQAPKVAALERIAGSDGGVCITNAAKDLQVRPKDLFTWLQAHGWIYRRQGGSGWVAYQARIQQGVLMHKVTVVSRSDGTEKSTEQVLVTPKGIARLAELLPGALQAGDLLA